MTRCTSGPLRYAFKESGCLGMQPKMGGKFHLKLNSGTRPIANKYREGKMKRTLKRELKVRETVKREAIEASICTADNQSGGVLSCVLLSEPVTGPRWYAVRGADGCTCTQVLTGQHRFVLRRRRVAGKVCLMLVRRHRAVIAQRSRSAACQTEEVAACVLRNWGG